MSTILIAFKRCEISVTLHGNTQNDMGFTDGLWLLKSDANFRSDAAVVIDSFPA